MFGSTGARKIACLWAGSLRLNREVSEDAGSSRSDVWHSAAEYLGRYFSSTARQKSRLLKKAPLEKLQTTALEHPDPGTRRECLYFLDHYANDASTSVFVEALQDPVGSVRNAALHSLACESCRTGPLCATEVVPAIMGVLDGDPSPDLRTKAIAPLLRLAGRDPRAWAAIEHAAGHDPDAIVRRAAAGALRGSFVVPRKRNERYQRRHNRTAARTASTATARAAEDLP